MPDHRHSPERARAARHAYRPAWWVPGRHLRTLWGKLVRRPPAVPTRTERWETPDGDFVDIVRLGAPEGRPRLFLLHGLEGTHRSHYVRGILAEAWRRGWGADVLLFRSCGPEINRARRSYHSGETTDAAFVLERLVREFPGSDFGLAGVSLGGNVLLKLLGERGEDLPPQVRCAVGVSVPYDLGLSVRYIRRGFSRVYEWHFLRTLRRKAQAKLERFPDLFAPERLERARTLYDFDDCVTAPVHGFADAEDYYTTSSSIRWLERIRLPTLLLSAVDDPFLPPEVLHEVRSIAAANPALQLEFVERGGHVGFISGRAPWKPVYYAEYCIAEFLAEHLPPPAGATSSEGALVFPAGYRPE